MSQEVKITVQVICYNQEDVIKRCLDSVLCQKNFVKEILVFDDCSTDNTGDILNEYRLEFPALIKVMSSDENLGIFGNVERRWKYSTDGIVYDLSGDDEVPQGWFEAVCHVIGNSQLDVNESIAIYGDFLVDYGKGRTLRLKNSRVRQGKDLWRLYQRGFINNRAVCYSSNIKLKYKSCLDGRSYVTENVQDSQLHLNVSHAIYLPMIGNIYHSGIGVSSSMSGEKWQQHLFTMLYSFEWYLNEGYKLNKRDVYLPDRNISWKLFLKKRSLSSLLKFLFFAVLSSDVALGINTNKLRHFQFKFVKK